MVASTPLSGSQNGQLVFLYALHRICDLLFALGGRVNPYRAVQADIEIIYSLLPLRTVHKLSLLFPVVEAKHLCTFSLQF